MAKNNFMKRPADDHRARLPRHPHNLSQQFTFTSSTGMILPVYYDFLNAGDTDYYSGSLLAKCQPLVTDAMIDVDFYLDWFFVPLSMMFTMFPSLRYMTDDFISSLYQDKFDDPSGSVNPNGGLPLCQIDSVVDCMDTSQTPNVWNPANPQIYPVARYDCSGKGFFRMLNHLGFNPYAVFKNDTLYDSNLPSRVNPIVFPMYALAYQAIFMDYFRVDDWDRRDNRFFNMDYWYYQSSAMTQMTYSPFTLRYRPYRLDYFKSVKSSPIMSSIGSIGGYSGQSNTPTDVLSKIDNYLQLTPSGYSPSPGIDTGSDYSGGSDERGNEFVNVRYGANQGNLRALSVNTANIRSMFAVEKLLRITGKANKNYDAQMLAHFGVKIPHDVKHELTHLGTDKGIMHLTQIVSTADTFESGVGGSALGQLSARGLCLVKGEKRKFTAPVDGVIMCVKSAVPRQNYFGTFDKQNAITSRLDFFTPEFDRLGSQPLFGYEFDYDLIGTSYRAGWQYRYSQWKLKYNRVSEAFRNPRIYNTVNLLMPWINGDKPFFNIYPQVGVTYLPIDEKRFCYCSPHDLDNCMVEKYHSGFLTAYSLTPWLMFVTDPFICQFDAQVKKVSVMSETGEPLMD